MIEKDLKKLVEQELNIFKKSNWSKSRINIERYRIKHALLGLCRECSEPILKNHVNCYKHNLRNNELMKKCKEQRKKEGRCIECNKLLNKDIDKKFKYCIWCRTKKSNPKRTKKRVYVFYQK